MAADQDVTAEPATKGAPSAWALRRSWKLACFILLIACGSKDPAVQRAERAERAKGEILIGAPWPWAARGGEMLYGQGVDLAVEEVNAAGGLNGRKIRMQREDDKESVDEGRLVARKLGTNPDVVAVLGHLQSHVAVPAAAIYDMAGVLMLAPAATAAELTTQKYRLVFRMMFTDLQAGRQLADYTADRGYKRVAIYYIRNSYGRNLSNSFEERVVSRGVAIVDRQSYDPGTEVEQRSYQAVLADWMTRQVDAIFLAAEVPHAAEFIREARLQGITAAFIGGDAMAIPDLIRLGGAAVEATTVASLFHADDPRPEVQKFVGSFQAKYGKAPDGAAALGYDAIHLVMHGMRRANSTVPAKVADALRATREWQGVTGAFTYDENGEVVGKRIIKLVVSNGKFEFLKEERIMAQAAR